VNIVDKKMVFIFCGGFYGLWLYHEYIAVWENPVLVEELSYMRSRELENPHDPIAVTIQKEIHDAIVT